MHNLSMEEIVRQDPQVTSITYASLPPLLNLDTEIEYNLFPQLQEREVKQDIQEIYTYLAGPIVQDNFERHPERRKWVEQMEKQYGQVFSDYIHKNKLRGNAITSVNGWASYLGDYYVGHQRERVEGLLSSIERLSNCIADDQSLLQDKLNLLPLFDQTLIAYISLFRKEG